MARKIDIETRTLPKTLITGGTGFLGKNLIQLLLDSGETGLRVLDLNSPSELAEKAETKSVDP